MEFEAALGQALACYGEDFVLKKQQIDCLRFIFEGASPVVVNLPVGFGKSLIFHLLPALFRHKYSLSSSAPSVVLVISPLSLIQTDQVTRLQKVNISSCRIEANGTVCDHSQLSEVLNGQIDIVHCHPEALFCTEAGSTLLCSPAFKTHLVAVVIDECHKVQEW